MGEGGREDVSLREGKRRKKKPRGEILHVTRSTGGGEDKKKKSVVVWVSGT